MVTSMEVALPRFPYVEKLLVPVVYPKPDALLYVKNIVGLEPVPATINTQGYGEQDGEFFIGSNIGKRNVVITFGLSTVRGGASVSDARALLYGYCMPKHLVKLIFYSDDHVPVAVEGHVESMTPNRFSQDPELQVSVICPRPNLTSVDAIRVFGQSRINPAETNIPYVGTIATGITLILRMGAAPYTGRIVLEHRMVGSGPLYRVIELASAVYPADAHLWVSTSHGERRLQIGYADPNAAKVNLLGKMSNASLWTYMASGGNLFRVRTPDSDVARNWELLFFEQYGGI